MKAVIRLKVLFACLCFDESPAVANGLFLGHQIAHGCPGKAGVLASNFSNGALFGGGIDARDTKRKRLSFSILESSFL